MGSVDQQVSERFPRPAAAPDDAPTENPGRSPDSPWPADTNYRHALERELPRWYCLGVLVPLRRTPFGGWGPRTPSAKASPEKVPGCFGLFYGKLAPKGRCGHTLIRLYFAVVDQMQDRSSRFLENSALDEKDRLQKLIYSISSHYSTYEMIVASVVTTSIALMFP